MERHHDNLHTSGRGQKVREGARSSDRTVGKYFLVIVLVLKEKTTQITRWPRAGKINKRKIAILIEHVWSVAWTYHETFCV